MQGYIVKGIVLDKVSFLLFVEWLECEESQNYHFFLQFQQ